jgi:hypothetical protein
MLLFEMMYVLQCCCCCLCSGGRVVVQPLHRWVSTACDGQVAVTMQLFEMLGSGPADAVYSVGTGVVVQLLLYISSRFCSFAELSFLRPRRFTMPPALQAWSLPGNRVGLG